MIEIHSRGYSRALPLIMLSLAVSQPSAETDMPGRRPHRTDGGYVLACRSPELFDAQALEFTRAGIVNTDDCVQLEDTSALVQENQYRIQTTTTDICVFRPSLARSASGHGQKALTTSGEVRSFLRCNLQRRHTYTRKHRN
jgi:hypothetical protein